MAKQDKTPEATQAPTKAPTQEPGEFNPFVHGLLTQASDLSEELRGKGGLYERIAANRDLLRNVKLTGLLSPEQAAAIDEFYPPRKAKDEAAETGSAETGSAEGDAKAA